MRTSPLLLILASCASVANTIGTMLVQGRADTLKTLRNIIQQTSNIEHIPLIDKSLNAVKGERLIKEETIRKLRARRHINQVVLESGQCDHIDLVDCSDFENDEMTCMLTATGMTCCLCTGSLRASKRSLF